MQQSGTKTAFFTVVYPAVIDYLDVFFSSLENQNNKVFDVVVFNDGLTEFDCEKYNLDIIEVECSGSPAYIRAQGIKYLLKNGYDYAVFGDSDDYFDKHRVESALLLLQQYDIVINDLTLVDQSGKMLFENYFSQRLDHLTEIDFDFIAECNICGLSNTAIRLSVVKNFDCPGDVLAADWYLFSLLLSQGASAVFSNGGITFYRQHGSNIAGFQEMTPDKALSEVRCKKLHYSAFSDVCPKMQRIADGYQRLLAALEVDSFQLQKYYEMIISQKNDFPFWWENIVLPEEYL